MKTHIFNIGDWVYLNDPVEGKIKLWVRHVFYSKGDHQWAYDLNKHEKDMYPYLGFILEDRLTRA